MKPADSHTRDARGCGGDPGGSAVVNTAEELAERLTQMVTSSTVIVCIGNDLCGDDGAGVEVGRRLAGSVPWPVFQAETVPESYVMKIVEHRPQSLVLVDAVELAAAPGSVRVLEADHVGGQGPSTHGPAPMAFFKLVQMMHPCRCVVVGIQPQSGGVDQPLAPAVRQAVELVVRAFGLLADRASD